MIADRINDLPETLQRDLRQFVRQRVEVVAGAAAEKAPIKFGTLRRSVSVDEHSDANLAYSIVFGGMASAYAEVQHEREDFRHDGSGRLPHERHLPSGGVHHYLFGRDHSAWESNEEAITRDLDEKAAEIARAVISRGV